MRGHAHLVLAQGVAIVLNGGGPALQQLHRWFACCLDVTGPALERLVGERLASDSAELRALVLLGVHRVREALLEDAYSQAVDSGDFNDTAAWVEQTTRARRRRRTPA